MATELPQHNVDDKRMYVCTIKLACDDVLCDISLLCGGGVAAAVE